MTSQAPFFSVVIPTRERPAWLSRCLRSVAQQSFSSYEVIVVDDGSERSYDEALASHPGPIEYVVRERAGGVASARNAGVARARGAWVAFLDDDDEWLPGFLAQSHDLLAKASDGVGLLWCNVQRRFFDADGKAIASEMGPFVLESLRSSELIRKTTWVGTNCGLTVRRACLDALGGFDESFSVGEDTELILKLLSAGYRPLHNPWLGVLVGEHRETRLGNDVRRYLRENVRERLLERYGELLRSDERLWADFVGHTARLRYWESNPEAGARLLHQMWRAKPDSVHVALRWLRVRLGSEARKAGRQGQRRGRPSGDWSPAIGAQRRHEPEGGK